MKSKKPELVASEVKTIAEAIDRIKKTANESAEACQEAQEYLETMKKHHKNIAIIMEELAAIEKDENMDRIERLRTIQEGAELVEDISQAMKELRTYTFEDDSMDIEEYEKELTQEEGADEALKELKEDDSRFMEKYLSKKAALGLATQNDVAELTGLDRRHISRIESGKTRPQYKTLKKLADAFGVDVSHFS